MTSEYNEQSSNVYDLNYSADLITCHADIILTVVDYFEEADTLMYRQKAQKEAWVEGN